MNGKTLQEAHEFPSRIQLANTRSSYMSIIKCLSCYLKTRKWKAPKGGSYNKLLQQNHANLLAQQQRIN